MLYRFYTIVFLLFILAAFAELFLSIPKSDKKIDDGIGKEFVQDFKEGVSFIKSSKIIFGAICISVLINFVFSPIASVGMPYIIKVNLAYSDIQFSFVESSLVVGMLIGGILSPKLKNLMYYIL